MKFALISSALPPWSSGAGVTLFNLLKNIDPSSYYLISTQKLSEKAMKTTFQDSKTLQLKAQYFRCPPDPLDEYFSFFLPQFFKNFRLVTRYLEKRAESICNIIKNEPCDAIVACTSDFISPPTAYFAARKMGIPFYFYLFDWYSRQWYMREWKYPHQKWFGNFFEELLMKNASGVIVPNEFLSDEIFRNYGIKSEIVRNSIDLSMYNGATLTQREKNKNGITIVFTGAIYDTNFQALINLTDAIKKIKEINVSLHLYVQHNIPKKIRNALTASFTVFHNPVPYALIPEIQKNADILFLPLSFNSLRHDIVKTSAPGKTGDYLASGTPTMVHAPPDSFLSWYFKKFKCGMVVDENNSDALADGITLFINNTDVQRTCVENALQQSVVDFDSVAATNKFLKYISAD
jgi:glycosyltransferase involved in cell wall biosynthesis